MGVGLIPTLAMLKTKDNILSKTNKDYGKCDLWVKIAKK
jgi:hypothetical protein